MDLNFYYTQRYMELVHIPPQSLQVVHFSARALSILF